MHESLPTAGTDLRVRRGKPPRIPFAIAAVLLAAVLVGAIWAPYGFSMSGLIEEWDMRYLYASGRMGWTAFPGQPMGDLFAARPLTPVPFVLAHVLAPHSFVGFHVLLIAACALKVFAGTAIGWWLFRNRILALCLGALVLVFPADTQQIALRNIHINLAIALMLAGCWLSLHALYAPRFRQRSVLVSLGALAALAGSAIYEPVLPLYVLTPLLIFARLGIGRAWRLARRRPAIVVAWSCGAITSGLYLFYAIAVRQSAYQVTLSGGKSGGILKSILAQAGELVDTAGYRVFFDSWRASWLIATEDMTSVGYFVVAFLLVSALLLVADRRSVRVPTSLARLLRTTAAGLVVLCAGYLPVLASASHVAISQRTFLSVAPGSAIVVVAVVALVALASRAATILICTGLVCLGLVMQVFQHDVYTRATVDVAEPYLERVAQSSDSTKRIHLVIDESGVGGNLGGVYVSKLKYGVPLLRSAFEDEYFLCRPRPLHAPMPSSTCRLEHDTWVVGSAEGAVERFPASQVDVITMHRPEPVPQRFSLFRPARASSERYECVADSMWGFNRFCPGEGWSDGETSRAGLRRLSVFHAVASSPSLFIDLKPIEVPYLLRIALAYPVPKAIAGRWQVEINGSPLALRPATATLYEAEVPRALLLSGANLLSMRNAYASADQPSLAVRRVILAPAADLKKVDVVSDIEFRPGVRYTIHDETMVAALVSGFSVPEPNGIWTDGSVARLRLHAPSASRGSALEIAAVPFLNQEHTSMRVEAWIGESRVAAFAFEPPASQTRMRIPLPDGRDERTPTDIRLLIKEPASPAQVGAGDRFLGLFLQEATVVE